MFTVQKISKIVVSIFLFLISLSTSFSGQNTPLQKNMSQKKVFPNGLTLIYQKDESSAITFLQILIKGGTGAVPEGKDGLAYMTTRLSIDIPDRGKIQELMKQASRIHMNCKGDYSLINLNCLSENLEDSLKVLIKIIKKPLFSGLRIGRIKEFMSHQSKAINDDPTIMANNAHLQSFFGKTAYGSSVYGTEDSLKAIKKKDIEGFYKKHFKAGNMIVSVSSDLDEKVLIELVQKYFSKFTPGKAEEVKPGGAILPEEKYIFHEKDTKQTLISIAFPLPEPTPKNFVLAHMVENLLGKGVDSKLWFLRSKKKLAYNVNSYATQMKEGGILNAYLETENKNLDTALDALKEVLLSLHEKGITEEELQATKTNTKAYFLRGNETKERRVSTLSYFAVVGLGHEFLDQFPAEIDAVNLEEINSYLKEILNPEKGADVIIGPKIEKDLPPSQKNWGQSPILMKSTSSKRRSAGEKTV